MELRDNQALTAQTTISGLESTRDSYQNRITQLEKEATVQQDKMQDVTQTALQTQEALKQEVIFSFTYS